LFDSQRIEVDAGRITFIICRGTIINYNTNNNEITRHI